MSDTPMTDAVVLACIERTPMNRLDAIADHARQLERKLVAAVAAKRPYSDKLAQEVIAEQVKEIDRLHKLLQAERRNTRGGEQGGTNGN